MIKTTTILKQISSNTKISILCWLLKEKELTITEIVTKTNLKRTNISKQINEMKRAKVLVSFKKGRNNIYSINKKLHPEQTKIIKSVVNSFHLVDEEKSDHKLYK